MYIFALFISSPLKKRQHLPTILPLKSFHFFFPFHFPYFKFLSALFAGIKFLYLRQNTGRKHFYIPLRYAVFVVQCRVNFPPFGLNSAFCLIHVVAAVSFVFRFFSFPFGSCTISTIFSSVQLRNKRFAAYHTAF